MSLTNPSDLDAWTGWQHSASCSLAKRHPLRRPALALARPACRRLCRQDLGRLPRGRLHRHRGQAPLPAAGLCPFWSQLRHWAPGLGWLAEGPHHRQLPLWWHPGQAVPATGSGPGLWRCLTGRPAQPRASRPQPRPCCRAGVAGSACAQPGLLLFHTHQRARCGNGKHAGVLACMARSQLSSLGDRASGAWC